MVYVLRLILSLFLVILIMLVICGGYLFETTGWRVCLGYLFFVYCA